jgi:hypothetical protein
MATTQVTAQWRIRTDGNELNGGGFDPDLGSTDYTDQAAAQLSLSDLACPNTSHLTSVTGGFTSAMVGNCIRIASGTNFVPGYYFVVSYISTNEVILFDNPTTGAVASGGTGRLGGAWADFRNVSIGGSGTAPLIANPAVPGNTVYVRGTGSNDGSIDYTHDEYYLLVNGDFSNGRIRFVGYNGRPCVTSSFSNLIFHQLNFTNWSNFKFITNDDFWRPSYGMVTGAPSADEPNHFLNCLFDQNGKNSVIIDGQSQGPMIFTACEFRGLGATNGSHSAINNYSCSLIQLVGCYVHDLYCNAAIGDDGNISGGHITVIDSVIARCGGDGINHDGYLFTQRFTLRNTTIDSCLGSGLVLSGTYGALNYNHITNNNFTNNGQYGIASTHSIQLTDRLRMFIDYNNFYGNTSGSYSQVTAGPNDTNLDPQYVNAAGDDFTPQNASLKGAGTPATIGAATDYSWIGAVQPDGGGAGGGGYVPQVFH